MPAWRPVSRRELIATLRRLGFQGPYSGGKTFAYACEAYARIVELGDRPSSRRGLLGELSHGPMPSDERVCADEYLDILREAVEARNGWKRILTRCTPARPRLRVGSPRRAPTRRQTV